MLAGNTRVFLAGSWSSNASGGAPAHYLSLQHVGTFATRPMQCDHSGTEIMLIFQWILILWVWGDQILSNCCWCVHAENRGPGVDGKHRAIPHWFYWCWNANSGDTGELSSHLTVLCGPSLPSLPHEDKHHAVGPGAVVAAASVGRICQLFLVVIVLA